MPLPIPNADESHDDFMNRCVADPDATSEYPDEVERTEVCQIQWDSAAGGDGDVADDEMLAPTPDPDEPQDAFMDRCMMDEEMVAMYPDETERRDACQVQFDSGPMTEEPSIEAELLPVPDPDETRDDFVARCVADPAAMEEYPDDGERQAACEMQFDNASATEGEGTGDAELAPAPVADETKDEFMLRCTSDESMVAEYPDDAIRSEVCEIQWNEAQAVVEEPAGDELQPTPVADETQDEFMLRCTSDETMIAEYPDEAERQNVCQIQWESAAAATDESTEGELQMPEPTAEEDHGTFMDRCMMDPNAQTDYPDEGEREMACQMQWDNAQAVTEPAGDTEPLYARRRSRPLPASSSWKSSYSLGGNEGVDERNAIIRGFVIAELGVFKTERGEFDLKSLQLIKQLMMSRNGAGLKSRFKHPTLSDDGLGKFLGRARNPRMKVLERDGKRTQGVVGDLFLDRTSFNTPDGNLADYVLQLAKSDRDALGASLVLEADEEYKIDPKTGQELLDADGYPLPPLWRPTKLHAVDVVDEGDATNSFLSGNLPDAAVRQAYELLNRQFPNQPRHVVETRCLAWLNRALDLRYGPKPKKLRRFSGTARRPQPLGNVDEALRLEIEAMVAEAGISD